MEVKPGYKQTEVGAIPEEWDVSPVRQKGEVVTGKALAVNAPGPQRPYLRTKNVFDGRIDIDDVLTMPMTDEQFAQFRVQNGDVLLNEGQSIELVGRCAIYQNEYPEPCAIQNALLRFRARPGVSERFASYLFRHCQQTGVFARIALQTTSVAHLGGSRFERLRLAWPTEEEQRAIATALSDVDGLLGGMDRLIAKKRDIKQASMQQLLTGYTRLPGFHGEWEVQTLGKLGAFVKGIGLLKDDIKTVGVIPAIPYTSLYTDFAEIVDHRLIKWFIDDAAGTYIVREPCVLIASSSNMEANTGKASALVGTTPVAVGREVIIFITTLDCAFVSYILSTPQYRRKTLSLARGTTIKHVYPATFRDYTIAIPALPEQTAIAGVLVEMDAELAGLEQRREKTRALKQAMMQELLSGRTRLL